MSPDSEDIARDRAAGGWHEGRIGRREALRRLGVLGFATGLLAACSPGTAVAPTSPATTGAAPTTAPATAAKPAASPTAAPSAAAAASAVPAASPVAAPSAVPAASPVAAAS